MYTYYFAITVPHVAADQIPVRHAPLFGMHVLSACENWNYSITIMRQLHCTQNARNSNAPEESIDRFLITMLIITNRIIFKVIKNELK